MLEEENMHGGATRLKDPGFTVTGLDWTAYPWCYVREKYTFMSLKHK